MFYNTKLIKSCYFPNAYYGFRYYNNNHNGYLVDDCSWTEEVESGIVATQKKDRLPSVLFILASSHFLNAYLL